MYVAQASLRSMGAWAEFSDSGESIHRTGEVPHSLTSVALQSIFGKTSVCCHYSALLPPQKCGIFLFKREQSFLEPYFFHLSGKVFSKCFLELQSYTCRLPEGAPSFSKHLLGKPELLAPRKALSLGKDFAGHCFPSTLLNSGRQEPSDPGVEICSSV